MVKGIFGLSEFRKRVAHVKLRKPFSVKYEGQLVDLVSRKTHETQYVSYEWYEKCTRVLPGPEVLSQSACLFHITLLHEKGQILAKSAIIELHEVVHLKEPLDVS